MKFSIGEQVNPTNLFLVEVDFMHGDADAYTTEEIPAGLVATDAAPILEYFEAHKGKRDYAESELNFSELVPYDVSYGYEHLAYVEAVNLYYFNSLGQKLAVTYETD